MPLKEKTKPNFYTWLRSGLRKLSRRWPPTYEALADAKVAYVGENKRRKFSYVCAICGRLFDAKSVAVDHIEPAGSLSCKEDIASFIEKLFCGKEGLQVLCKDNCHAAKTYAEKMNISFEEAKLAKDVIAFSKLSLDEQAIILNKLGADSIAKTKTGRVEQYKKLNGLK